MMTIEMLVYPKNLNSRRLEVWLKSRKPENTEKTFRNWQNRTKLCSPIVAVSISFLLQFLRFIEFLLFSHGFTGVLEVSTASSYSFFFVWILLVRCYSFQTVSSAGLLCFHMWFIPKAYVYKLTSDSPDTVR